MTVATEFQSWQRAGDPRAPYDRCSPNLQQLMNWIRDQWPVTNLGCYGRRPIRGGTAWSSHAFGAAIDVGYESRPTAVTIINELVHVSYELGIQRIHDYHSVRYWEAGRGWVMRPPGVGTGQWLHIETHPDQWANATPIAGRFTGTTVVTPPTAPKYPGRVTKLGSRSEAVRNIQRVLGLTVDGWFGPVTDRAVRQFQQANGLVVDGLVGPLTWAELFPTD